MHCTVTQIGDDHVSVGRGIARQLHHRGGCRDRCALGAGACRPWWTLWSGITWRSLQTHGTHRSWWSWRSWRSGCSRRSWRSSRSRRPSKPHGTHRSWWSWRSGCSRRSWRSSRSRRPRQAIRPRRAWRPGGTDTTFRNTECKVEQVGAFSNLLHINSSPGRRLTIQLRCADCHLYHRYAGLR